ncbi:MAG: hypothetical protein GY718_04595 [Lentisphaerae bacterium]|nr:hypothetical protein [Lentisphaerota bacterium]
MRDELKFYRGDDVRWSSQAQGTWKKKTGQIIAVVPPRSQPEDTLYQKNINTAEYYSYEFGNPRDHESYIIAVNGKTNRAKPRLYWPKVKGLELDGGNNGTNN